MSCALAGEQDIYGIGVRVAVYAQNLLSFFPAFWALKDGEVSRTELAGLETQSTTILITAFAVLVSAIIQAATGQINSFHTFVVLSLSWMNNTNTFIWVFLYVHHVAWEKGLSSLNLLQWRFWALQANSRDVRNSTAKGMTVKIPWPRMVILLGTLHLSLMGAVGTWMWLSFSVIGVSTPLFDACTRIASMVIYSIALIPLLNISLPLLSVVLLYRWSNGKMRDGNANTQALATPRSWPIHAALGFLLALNIILICDIELTLARNGRFQSADDDAQKSSWTFGQTLALLLLAVPLRDIYDTVWERTDKRRQKSNNDALRGFLGGNPHELIRQLIEDGGDPNMESSSPDCRFSCPLQLAVHNHDKDAIIYYGKRGVKFSGKAGMYGTAFEHALACRNQQVIDALLDLYDASVKRENRSTHLHSKVRQMIADNDHTLVALYKNNATPNRLHVAAQLNSLSMVNHLLESGTPMNQLDANGDSILHVAVRHESYKTVLLVLCWLDDIRGVMHRVLPSETVFQLENPISHLLGVTKDAQPRQSSERFELNICQPNFNGETALSFASAAPSKLSQLLYEYIASRNLKDELGNSALHLEARAGHSDVVTSLLHHQLDPNATNADKCTALHYAAENGCLKVVEALLHANADRTITNNEGWTPLDLAAKNGHIDIMKALMNSQDGESHLHHAVQTRRQDIVKALIEAGVDPNAPNPEGWTPLLCAAKSGHTNVVSALVDAKANLNVTDEHKETPLHYAAKSGCTDIVKALVNGKADLNTASSEGQTPLHYAARSGSIDAMTILLNANVELNVASSDGQTALHYGVNLGCINIVNALVNAKADLNCTDKNAHTPLHYAVKTGRTCIMRTLIEAKADLNVTDTEGWTPLHYAAHYGRIDLVSPLVEAKADLSVTDVYGRTPLHYATEGEYDDVMDVLLNATTGPDAV